MCYISYMDTCYRSLAHMRTLLLLAILAWPAVPVQLMALPTFSTDEGSNDRISVTLSTNDRNIHDDAESYCGVRISGSGNLRSGEEITVKVWYNDVLSFEAEGTVSSSEGSSDSLTRFYDCSGNFGTASTYEVRAYVKVEDNCTLLCYHDEVDDLKVYSSGVFDDLENNNSPTNATELTDEIIEYISRTDDYFSFTLTDDSDVDITVYSYASEGELDVAVYQDTGLDELLELEQRDVISFYEPFYFESLDPGTYYVTVSPLFPQDYNFFEINYQAFATGQDCSSGEEETRVCGNCGSQTRVCNSEGAWSAWSPCDIPEGNCEPGAERSSLCDDDVSNQEELCSVSCAWLVTQACPIYEQDAGSPEDGGTNDAPPIDPPLGEDAGWGPSVAHDAGQSVEPTPSSAADAGSRLPGRTEQPAGEITAVGGCACNDKPIHNGGKTPLILLLVFWWLSVRNPQRRTLSYFGRSFQGRWVCRRD